MNFFENSDIFNQFQIVIYILNKKINNCNRCKQNISKTIRNRGWKIRICKLGSRPTDSDDKIPNKNPTKLDRYGCSYKRQDKKSRL